jgi:hypothetical protein
MKYSLKGTSLSIAAEQIITQWLKTTNTHYLTASEGQEFVQSLAQWLCLKPSQEQQSRCWPGLCHMKPWPCWRICINHGSGSSSSSHVGLLVRTACVSWWQDTGFLNRLSVPLYPSHYHPPCILIHYKWVTKTSTHSREKESSCTSFFYYVF